jgi:signal transduction histidine kinase
MTPLEAALLDVLASEGAAVLVRAPDGAVTYASAAARELGWDAPGAAVDGAAPVGLADGSTLFLRRAAAWPDGFFEARETMHNTIAHDLLTPIGVVDGFAELLLMSIPDDPELQMFAERVRAGSGRLTLLARMIGPYAWLSAGLPVSSQRVDLGPLLDAVLLTVAARARDRAVLLEMRDGDESLAVQGDAPLVFLALEQVVVNALVYSEPGQSVRVSVERDGGDIALIVRDHGIGIPGSELDTVFLRNTRGTSPGVQSVSGAGYGLTVARIAIERMGGQIALTSAPGEGTTVTLRLRAAEGLG